VLEFDVAGPPSTAMDVLRRWTPRQFLLAAAAAAAIALVIGLPTDVIPNPVFGRPVPVTWWSYPTLLLTAVLGGLLAGTYVRPAAAADASVDASVDAVAEEIDTPTRRGGLAGLLSFFAVGCPVCNKLVIVALGTTGARQWFEPVQPLLAVASIVLLVWALRTRLRSAESCRIT
jgi:MFS family permease